MSKFQWLLSDGTTREFESVEELILKCDRYREALEEIVACDYRGNMPHEQYLAKRALTPPAEGEW